MKSVKIGVLGLGYVGLPITVAFAKKFDVVGYDVDKNRVNQLNKGTDKTNEISKIDLKKTKAKFTCKLNDLEDCNFFIVSVPTPINIHNKPDLRALKSASTDVGKIIKRGGTVVFESTVFPGATEEICVPIIEKMSKLKASKDFYYGYSPERINPGDKKRTLEKIVKVTSGCSSFSRKSIDNVYKKIIKAGTYSAPSVKVAEAAKVIENTQRDVNIALVNELSMIFQLEGIDTKDVLETAKTKWNFLDFEPGLVGGHCIGVDPYYLTYRANQHGYNPKLVLSGRRINNNMAKHISMRVKSIAKNKKGSHKKILVKGVTFKEDCPDTRNSKIRDLVQELKKDFQVDVYDPIADPKEVKNNLGIKLIKTIKKIKYDIILIAVPHKIFTKMSMKEILNLGHKDSIFFDLKSVFPKSKNFFRP